jgi:flagellar protein FlbD
MQTVKTMRSRVDRKHRSKELDSTVIQLTRLRHDEVFLLNPDLFERVDSYVDTVVRLTNGNEYVVSESAAEIIERIVLFRAGVLAAGFAMQENSTRSEQAGETTHATIVRGELGSVEVSSEAEPEAEPEAQTEPEPQSFGPPANSQPQTSQSSSNEVHQR